MFTESGTGLGSELIGCFMTVENLFCWALVLYIPTSFFLTLPSSSFLWFIVLTLLNYLRWFGTELDWVGCFSLYIMLLCSMCLPCFAVFLFLYIVVYIIVHRHALSLSYLVVIFAQIALINQVTAFYINVSGPRYLEYVLILWGVETPCPSLGRWVG